MISSINNLSSNSIALLFGSTAVKPDADTNSSGTVPPGQTTGNTDDVFKAGHAIGKIIEIVAGMKSDDANRSIGVFTMDGATRVDGVNGEYTLTKTGTGKVVSDEQMREFAIEIKQKQASGTGPRAEEARAYLKAAAEGTIVEIDLSAHGVSATLTQTNYFYADGSPKGESGSSTLKGLEEFLAANSYIAEDGTRRDNATGKYASFNANGTSYSYIVF
jgi:hypothetical protein